MKKNQIKVGGYYKAKVSNKIVIVRVDTIRERSDYKGNMKTVYDITNIMTKRTTTFRSASKFREECTVVDENDCYQQGVKDRTQPGMY